MSTWSRCAGALALLALAACAAPAPTAAPAERPAIRARAPFLTVARVSSWLDELRRERGFPGATCGFVLPDGSVGEVVVGFADRARTRALQPTDRMLAGSIGKTFVAAVAVQLADEGRLDLDARLARYLGDEPWFGRLANGGTVTLRELLHHRSGIPDHVFLPEFWAAVNAAPDRSWRPEELVALVLDAPPRFAPGEDFEYTDTNYILVGMVLERVSGETWYALAERRLLEPLALDGIVPAVGRRIARLVPGHLAPTNPFGWPESTVEDGRFVIDPSVEWTGGGFASTAPDLALWGHLLYGGELLGPARTRELLDATETGSARSPGRYGLGVQVWDTPLGEAHGHGGWFPGYLSQLVWLPEHRLALAVQVNSDADDLGRSVRELAIELAQVVLDEDGSAEEGLAR